jgi:two-component system response regulator HydG
MEKLVKYNWPGNVRELMNAVERAVVLSRSEYLDADKLVMLMADSPTAAGIDQFNIPENVPLDEGEKRIILEAVNACGGNKSEAARRLGITRKTLRKKLDKYKNAETI